MEGIADECCVTRDHDASLLQPPVQCSTSSKSTGICRVDQPPFQWILSSPTGHRPTLSLHGLRAIHLTLQKNVWKPYLMDSDSSQISPSLTGNHDEANAPPLPSLTKSTASEPFFIPTNEPHLFPIPGPHTSSLPHRQPPHPCVKNPDIVDVDMGEISPNILKIQQQPQEASPSKLEKDLKVVALDRTRSPFRSRRGKVPPGRYDLDVGGGSVNSEDEERSDREGQAMKRARPTTNHHYTLKLATDIPATNADLPYALSGLVFRPNLFHIVDVVRRYLRVFFSTSLSMVFLWLLLQFILTVQKDVQQRVLEHSMGTTGLPACCEPY